MSDCANNQCRLCKYFFYIIVYYNSIKKSIKNGCAILSIFLRRCYVEDFGYGKINIFPNPTKNILNIQNCQNTNYEIFDVNGKVLQTGKIYDSIQTLDMSNFAKGNIFIKLQDNENIYIMKIVKM